jgi:MerR family transcriptional regulator, light-induced transcriptional regulator
MPEQLARLSSLAPTIACECPHHLVDLFNSMAAFEAYRHEYENKNTEDAQMHSYLHETTGRSRTMLETALQNVAEFEGIELD